MKTVSLMLLFLLALSAASTAEAAVGEGGHLHTFAIPKLKVFTGAETANIRTWDQAVEFCAAQPYHKELANKCEICQNRRRPRDDNMSTGLKKDDQWVPIRDARQKNHWLQIGVWNNGTEATAGTCETYRDLNGIPHPDTLKETTAVVAEPITYCEKPKDCTENQCVYQCPHNQGYYPDPTDCRAFCYCSGGTEPSFWEQVQGDDLIWNPFCADSSPLRGKEVPLGGMDGGCPAHSHYIDGMSYCKREGAQRKLQEKETPLLRGGNDDMTSHRELQDWEFPYDYRLYDNRPHWGYRPDKYVGESNTVVCSSMSEAPELPQTCGALWGDPHFVTYDGLMYEFQGTGEFTFAKSLDSGLELQGVMRKFAETLQATVTEGVVLKTGLPDEPTVEIRYPPGQCKLDYFIDDKYVDIEGQQCMNGTLATGTEKVHYFRHRQDRYFFYPGSKISFHVKMKKSAAMGCYMNVKVCLPDELIQAERIVGLFGSPNGNQKDDFTDKFGNDLDHKGKVNWGHGYNYATQHWCVRDKADSLFKTPSNNLAAGCDEPYDPTLEQQVAHASPELRAICGNDIACLVEGSAGGKEDSTDSVRELKEEHGVEIIPNETPLDPDPVEEKEIFEKTPSTTQSAGTVIRSYSGQVSGDPHFKTWAGVKFEFHGACDLVLLHAPDYRDVGLRLHIRTKSLKMWSYVDTAVLQIGNQTLEIQGGNDETYWVNGVAGPHLDDKAEFNFSQFDYGVHLRRISDYQRIYRVAVGNDTAISFEVYKDFVKANVYALARANFVGGSGMLGEYPSGVQIGRDGHTIIHDPNAYGAEWQVRSSEPMLFHNVEGPQHPELCTMPDETAKGEARRMLGESLISRDEAEVACAVAAQEDLSECIFDVLAANDITLVNMYAKG